MDSQQADSQEENKRSSKTTPFGVDSLRSQVLCDTMLRKGL